MSTDFPSGQWFGFYCYEGYSPRFLMDLILEFAQGRIHGEGQDDIGPFVIDGIYCGNTKECSWTKTYVGQHSVEYTGFREGKGIWGTWTLDYGKGGFHIWPLGELPPPEAFEEVEEEAVTRELTLLETPWGAKL